MTQKEMTEIHGLELLGRRRVFQVSKTRKLFQLLIIYFGKKLLLSLEEFLTTPDLAFELTTAD